MKKALILIILFIVLIGGFFALKNKSAEKASADTLTEPWIVVESDTVTEIDANGTVLRTLVTGDEVVSGATVQTDTEGSAVLYFPDGSQARIDPNTTLTVTEATYESDTDSLVVRLSVSTGRVWSNVISFINSDSSWEVETAHAVATVRGTSFGTDADSEHTTFIGSESTVAIFALDPTTGKPVLETETTITTDDVIELRREDVEILISEKREIVKKKIEDLTQTRINEWIERQRENDGPLQKRFEELRAQDLSPEEVRATIRAEIQEAFTAEVEKRREELRKQLEEKEDVARETIADKVRDTLTEALPFDAIRTTITQHLSERNENELAEKVRNYSNEELLMLLKKYLG